MRLVVTGALGHIGSRLVRDLPFVFPDSEIIMIDNLITQRYCALYDLPPGGNYRFIEGDISEVSLSQFIDGKSCVIHLAAITDAANGFNWDSTVKAKNLACTKRIIDVCVQSGAKLITFSSTSVYGSQEEIVNEGCLELRPQSPYASTKLDEEKLVQTSARNEGLNAVILRLGTIYGKSIGMRFHTAVNKFCWQAATRQPITVWKTAYQQKRPYLALADAVKSIVHVIRNNMFECETYNIVTRNYTVEEIIETIKVFMKDLSIEYTESQIMNQLSYEVDSNKFRATGVILNFPLDVAIGETLSMLKNLNSSARRLL